MSSTVSTAYSSSSSLGGIGPATRSRSSFPELVSTDIPSGSVPDETDLLSVSWNQDYGCFAAGTTSGFRIYNCDPFKQTFRRDLNTGGFGIVEMLFRCNILALVGGGANTQYPPNKVIIWDDHQSRCISEFSFRSEVRAVKLRRDSIVVALEHKVYVYSFMDLRLIHQIETVANPRGLCCVSHHSNTFVLACPGLHRGQIRVEHFGLKVTKFINAHDSQIACFTLTMDGLLLATASVKGTLVRIFNTMDGTRLQEVRRGVDRADIYSLALSPNVQWLAVSSDKGTVHIFSLRVRVVGEDSSNLSNTAPVPAMVHQYSSTSLDSLISPTTGANPGSSLSFMRGTLAIMGKYHCYVVIKGRNEGIYSTWEDCKVQVDGYPNALYWGCHSEEEAVEALSRNQGSKTSKRTQAILEKFKRPEVVQDSQTPDTCVAIPPKVDDWLIIKNLVGLLLGALIILVVVLIAVVVKLYLI